MNYLSKLCFALAVAVVAYGATGQQLTAAVESSGGWPAPSTLFLLGIAGLVLGGIVIRKKNPVLFSKLVGAGAAAQAHAVDLIAKAGASTPAPAPAPAPVIVQPAEPVIKYVYVQAPPPAAAPAPAPAPRPAPPVALIQPAPPVLMELPPKAAPFGTDGYGNPFQSQEQADQYKAAVEQRAKNLADNTADRDNRVYRGPVPYNDVTLDEALYLYKVATTYPSRFYPALTNAEAVELGNVQYAVLSGTHEQVASVINRAGVANAPAAVAYDADAYKGRFLPYVEAVMQGTLKSAW